MRCLDCDEDEVKDNDEDAKEVGDGDVFVQQLRGLLRRATGIEELKVVKLTTLPGGRHIESKECAYS